ncbi:hypothetical protein PHLGIDRAFT_87678 [Phlebiopsis gigantea 11061_1 CR5-6]|uniref:CCZ1/INTU/HSP4 first Longin domain-containing protein n=1 Tax=Phlebiopsis gigantea (strain 11061_1 CR5-6) TaxID=745531 RepID=A0A0C3SCH2_PHLG1|nr:hypothetical protein PHLGIDRAFT_87678 [Phlebiopsis gigantea 11061_1 CR5-6]
MSRVPPGLLYLTIYNPSIKPSEATADDDEDAEEQAQILFYTARERAVSRDRTLRQVGLAKALVNFTGMFSSSAVCENTHSQSRRMIMVSPEPDFWIHACLELAKSPRPIPSKTTKGKGAGKAAVPPPQVVYDYHDGSIHDLALRARILRGYEEFKLTHGSFASILTSLGQQALELQLERFFTVWAWKWDPEGDINFGDHLGPPMHPMHHSQTPLLDAFSSEYLGSLATFLLIPPYIVPSKQLTSSEYPSVLTNHIMSRLPQPPAPAPQELPSTLPSTDFEKRSHDLPVVAPSAVKSLNQTIRAAGPLFNVDMPNLKWMWSGLTFPKSSSTKPSASHTPVIPPDLPLAGTQPSDMNPNTTLSVPKSEVEVDAESLQDAMTSDGWASSLPSPTLPETVPLPPSPVGDDVDESTEYAAADLPEEGTPRLTYDTTMTQRIEQQAAIPPSLTTEVPLKEWVPPVSIPEFQSAPVYLASGSDPLQTRKHKVFYATQDQFTFAFLAADGDEPDLECIAEQLPTLFSDLAATLGGTRESEDVATPVAKLLEPQTKHVIYSDGFTSTSRPESISKSDHLYNGRQMLHGGFDIHEVFSRGQNPQHWHISRCGLGQSGENVQGEVYMEVARKESTLTDVDNELAGIVRRFLE